VSQVASVNLDDPGDCWEKFASNKWIGALIFAGLFTERTAQWLNGLHAADNTPCSEAQTTDF
jgi:hypothetical protein